MNTNEIRVLAEELLTLGAIRDAIQIEYKKRYTELQTHYQKMGVERQRITTADGVDFGTLVLASEKIEVEITDQDAMLEWLEQYHPEEIHVTYTINPAYLRKLVQAAQQAGVGVDPDTGERLDWLTVSVGDKTLRPTPSRAAKKKIRDLLTGTGINLQLEAPSEGE